MNNLSGTYYLTPNWISNYWYSLDFLRSTHNLKKDFLFFHQITIFSFLISHFFWEGSKLTLSLPKKFFKWKQVKITNLMIQTHEVFSRFGHLYIFDELFDLFKSANFNWDFKKTIKLSRIFWRYLNFEIKTFRQECRLEKSQTKQ